MNILDWIIIIWLVLAFFAGARSGLVFWLGNIIGLLLGIYVAGLYYSDIAGWIGGGGWSQLIAFMVVLILISIVSGIVAHVLNKAFNFLRWIPFLSTANHILGGVLAVIVNMLLLSVLLYFASHIEISSVLTQTIAESRVAAILLVISIAISWILPSSITELEALF